MNYHWSGLCLFKSISPFIQTGSLHVGNFPSHCAQKLPRITARNIHRGPLPERTPGHPSCTLVHRCRHDETQMMEFWPFCKCQNYLVTYMRGLPICVQIFCNKGRIRENVHVMYSIYRVFVNAKILFKIHIHSSFATVSGIKG